MAFFQNINVNKGGVVTLQPTPEERKQSEEEDCPDADIDDPTPNNLKNHAKYDNIAVAGNGNSNFDETILEQIHAIEQVYDQQNGQQINM